jgi:hypothetical protein
MFTSTSNANCAEAGAADVLIPLIRAAATIGFAIAPYSLGFVIIAVSEQLIRSIMVGDDPEMLMSDLQNQFPDAAIEPIEDKEADGLTAKVVDLIERSGIAPLAAVPFGQSLANHAVKKGGGESEEHHAVQGFQSAHQLPVFREIEALMAVGGHRAE